MSIEELSDCPFCRSPAETECYPPLEGVLKASCSNSDCILNSRYAAGSLMLTVEEWNDRPEEKRLRANNDRLGNENITLALKCSEVIFENKRLKQERLEMADKAQDLTNELSIHCDCTDDGNGRVTHCLHHKSQAADVDRLNKEIVRLERIEKSYNRIHSARANASKKAAHGNEYFHATVIAPSEDDNGS